MPYSGVFGSCGLLYSAPKIVSSYVWASGGFSALFLRVGKWWILCSKARAAIHQFYTLAMGRSDFSSVAFQRALCHCSIRCPLQLPFRATEFAWGSRVLGVLLSRAVTCFLQNLRRGDVGCSLADGLAKVSICLPSVFSSTPVFSQRQVISSRSLPQDPDPPSAELILHVEVCSGLH